MGSGPRRFAMRKRQLGADNARISGSYGRRRVGGGSAGVRCGWNQEIPRDWGHFRDLASRDESVRYLLGARAGAAPYGAEARTSGDPCRKGWSDSRHRAVTFGPKLGRLGDRVAELLSLRTVGRDGFEPSISAL